MGGDVAKDRDRQTTVRKIKKKYIKTKRTSIGLMNAVGCKRQGKMCVVIGST